MGTPSAVPATHLHADGEDRPMRVADVLLHHSREPPLLRFTTGVAGLDC